MRSDYLPSVLSIPLWTTGGVDFNYIINCVGANNFAMFVATLFIKGNASSDKTVKSAS